MDKNSKIYIAGHKGMVGSAIWKHLNSKGFYNLIGKTSKELDLRNQSDVFNFYQNEKPNIVCWNHWENWPEYVEKGYYHYPNVKYITMKGLPQVGHPTLPILEAGTLPPLKI